MKAQQIIAIALSLLVAVYSASAQKKEELKGEVHIDGSSTVYRISEAVAEEFGHANPKVQVTVGISGTGGGFKKFCAGETDISDASRPIKKTEAELCAKNSVDYVEIPIAFDAISIVVNPANNWASAIKVEELRQMWNPAAEQKITKWNQIRPDWPDAPLKLFGPGIDSGTFDYFTEAVVGKEDASRSDFTSSEDDNVLVQGVSSEKYGLGYFGLAYYEENKDKLKALAVDNGSGPVIPESSTVKNATYQPLSRPLFIYVARKASSRPEIQAFVNFYIKNAPVLSKEVGYVPLSDELYALTAKRFSESKLGSIFAAGGSQVGVRLQDLYKAEMK